MNASDWVEAGNYPTPILAHIAQARLEAHGIEAAVFDAEIAGSWVYTNALGGVRLMVAPENLEAAEDILAQEEEAAVDSDVVTEEDAISEDQPYCPHCHSKDIETMPAASGWMRRVRGFLGIGPRLRCRACGRVWSA